MTKTTVKNINSLEVFADFSMVEKFNELCATITKEDALKQVNELVKTQAINKIITLKGVNWVQFIDGVIYEQINEDGEPIFKNLKVNDLFILKANKNSTKKVLASDLFVLLECFGCNVLDAELNALEDDTLRKMNVYTKHVPAFKCFTEETRTGNNSLEEQFQIFLDFFYKGAEVPKARKTYIKHLKRQYVTATKNGYKNGNALALLQLVINHAYDCKHNITYEVKSGLTSHKAPKEKANK